ncbi:MAG: NitT/TauT family transport system permease protein [Chloroflexota bacterium]|nr:NitT/TauT family transport system permease protein [Chloroflexota bacterium]
MLGIAALVLLIWFLFSGSFLVAAPLPTLGLLFQGLFTDGWMRPHIGVTFGAVLIGFGLALAVGLGAGILLGRSPYWRNVFEPILLALYSIPKIILFPVFLLLFGTGAESRIAMAFVHAVFPLIVSTMVGVSIVSPTHMKVARVLRMQPWQVVGKIYFPSMAPTLVAGMRMGFSLAIVGVVLAELFASREGLGFLIMRAYGQLNIQRMFAVILFLFLVALLVNVSLWALEKRLRAHQ